MKKLRWRLYLSQAGATPTRAAAFQQTPARPSSFLTSISCSNSYLHSTLRPVRQVRTNGRLAYEKTNRDYCDHVPRDLCFSHGQERRTRPPGEILEGAAGNPGSSGQRYSG